MNAFIKIVISKSLLIYIIIEKLISSLAMNKIALKQIRLQYQTLDPCQPSPFPILADVGFRIYSQVDEDGIIHYIFSVIGEKSKQFIEIGTGNGLECNCANLAINLGWHGLFIDCDQPAIELGALYYSLHPDTKSYPPKFVCKKVSKENINEIIISQGFNGEIDLLSIDIDGIDYWILDSISIVKPRVIIAEINPILGTNPISVPYFSDFVHKEKDYYGASLPAFKILLKRKGYRLIGTNRYGFNAFFLREDIAPEFFSEVSVESCRIHPRFKEPYYQHGFEKISGMEYIKIE